MENNNPSPPSPSLAPAHSPPPRALARLCQGLCLAMALGALSSCTHPRAMDRTVNTRAEFVQHANDMHMTSFPFKLHYVGTKGGYHIVRTASGPPWIFQASLTAIRQELLPQWQARPYPLPRTQWLEVPWRILYPYKAWTMPKAPYVYKPVPLSAEKQRQIIELGRQNHPIPPELLHDALMSTRQGPIYDLPYAISADENRQRDALINPPPSKAKGASSSR